MFLDPNEDYEEGDDEEASPHDVAYATLLSVVEAEFTRPGWLGPTCHLKFVEAAPLRGIPAIFCGGGESPALRLVTEANIGDYFKSVDLAIYGSAVNYVKVTVDYWKRCQKPGVRFNYSLRTFDVGINGRLKKEVLTMILCICYAVQNRPLADPMRWYIPKEQEQAIVEAAAAAGVPPPAAPVAGGGP